jgi:adenine-specific DNA-methyltransferase
MRLEKRINLCYANEDQESSIGYPPSEQFRGDEAESRMWLPKKGDAYDTLFSAPEEDIPSMAFPSTRFYGSKRRQLSWLQTELSRVQGRTALDAFGGTGAVSYLLGKLGFQTTYNDIFEFNTISARAIFSRSALSFNELSLHKLLQGVIPIDGFISETFHGLYFTQEENRWLDGIMHLISGERQEVRDLVLHCLFQACLKKRPFNLFHRANLGLRQSTVPVQFGNRTTWERSFSHHIISAYGETLRAQWSIRDNVSVAQASCAKQVDGQYDLIYLDPPYFKKRKRNTDTYLQRYHFLEGLARYDEWPNLVDMNSPQRVLTGPYRDEWVDKRQLLSNIREMVTRNRGATFALSYVSGEEPTEEELFRLFTDYFDNVRLSRRSFNKVLSNKKSFEILLIGR